MASGTVHAFFIESQLAKNEWITSFLGLNSVNLDKQNASLVCSIDENDKLWKHSFISALPVSSAPGRSFRRCRCQTHTRHTLSASEYGYFSFGEWRNGHRRPPGARSGKGYLTNGSGHNPGTTGTSIKPSRIFSYRPDEIIFLFAS